MEESKQLLTDLSLSLGDHRIRPVYRVGQQQNRLPAGRGSVLDITRISGRDNLRQAIMMRLLTPIGELADLGHPTYGSRLPDLVGRLNNETGRNLVRLYIMESLQQEARVAKVEKIVVTTVVNQPNLVAVELEVLPISATDSMNIGPFTLAFN